MAVQINVVFLDPRFDEDVEYHRSFLNDADLSEHERIYHERQIKDSEREKKFRDRILADLQQEYTTEQIVDALTPILEMCELSGAVECFVTDRALLSYSKCISNAHCSKEELIFVLSVVGNRSLKKHEALKFRVKYSTARFSVCITLGRLRELCESMNNQTLRQAEESVTIDELLSVYIYDEEISDVVFRSILRRKMTNSVNSPA